MNNGESAVVKKSVNLVINEELKGLNGNEMGVIEGIKIG